MGTWEGRERMGGRGRRGVKERRGKGKEGEGKGGEGTEGKGEDGVLRRCTPSVEPAANRTEVDAFHASFQALLENILL